MKNPMMYEKYDHTTVILECSTCKDNDYKCEDKHRWGVCHVRCSDCGLHENVTVQLCDTNNYRCYDCERKAK